VATAVTLSIAFLPPIGDTFKSHLNVHGRSDKIYHQLMATQVKFPRESLATEAAHSLRHASHRSQGPKHLGPTLSIFGFLLAPTYYKMLEHWCQGINKCWNIGPKGCKLASQIRWYPFFSLGSIQGYKVQHLLVTWGWLKIFFLFQPWLLL
jgi:hypothetical protein